MSSSAHLVLLHPSRQINSHYYYIPLEGRKGVHGFITAMDEVRLAAGFKSAHLKARFRWGRDRAQ